MQNVENLRQSRKSIRLKEFDYSTPWWYYITICTRNHKILFGEINNAKMLLSDFGKLLKVNG